MEHSALDPHIEQYLRTAFGPTNPFRVGIIRPGDVFEIELSYEQHTRTVKASRLNLASACMGDTKPFAEEAWKQIRDWFEPGWDADGRPVWEGMCENSG